MPGVYIAVRMMPTCTGAALGSVARLATPRVPSTSMTHLPSRRSRRPRGAPRHPDPWPSALPTTSISSCSARAPAATPRRSVPAQLGLKVALVDEDKIGGTCLHRGCIPTKALLESAAFADRVRHAKDYGVVLAGRADRRLRGDGRPARRRRQAPVDRAQDPRRQEQGDLGRRPRPARRSGQGQGQPARRGRHAGQAAATAS